MRKQVEGNPRAKKKIQTLNLDWDNTGRTGREANETQGANAGLGNRCRYELTSQMRTHMG